MDVTEPQWHAGRKTKLCDYLEHVLTFMWHHPVGEACACPMKHTPALRLRTRRTDKGITEATSLIAKCQLQAMAPQQWPEEPSCSHQLQLCQHGCSHDTLGQKGKLPTHSKAGLQPSQSLQVKTCGTAAPFLSGLNTNVSHH